MNAQMLFAESRVTITLQPIPWLSEPRTLLFFFFFETSGMDGYRASAQPSSNGFAKFNRIYINSLVQNVNHFQYNANILVHFFYSHAQR